MSRELRANYNGAGANLYVILRRVSDGYAWDVAAAAWEAWDNASIGDYDIAMTDRGGDLYTADIPSGIAAGTSLRIMYYERAGATPATTDLLLNTQEREWNGDTLVSDSIVSLSANALTTIANLERFEGIGDIGDTLATQVINAASAFVERATGVEFKARNRRERFNAFRQERLQIRYPVLNAPTITYGEGLAFTLTYAGAAILAHAGAFNDFSSATSGNLRLFTMTAAGTETETTLGFSTYPTISTLCTAINLVSGWTASASVDAPSYDLIPESFGDVKNQTVQVLYPDRMLSGFRTDAKRGQVEFANAGRGGDWWGTGRHTNQVTAGNFPTHGRRFWDGFQSVLVKYRSGYETIPADVEWLATELAAEKYYSSLDHPGIKSRTTGPVSVTFSDSDYSMVRERLAHYIDHSQMVA